MHGLWVGNFVRTQKSISPWRAFMICHSTFIIFELGSPGSEQSQKARVVLPRPVQCLSNHENDGVAFGFWFYFPPCELVAMLSLRRMTVSQGRIPSLFVFLSHVVAEHIHQKGVRDGTLGWAFWRCWRIHGNDLIAIFVPVCGFL